MCSCNGHNVKLLIGADFLTLLSNKQQIEFKDKFRNYEYGGNLMHTGIHENEFNLYKDYLQEQVSETTWDSYNDIQNLLLKIDNFLTNQVPKLNFKNLIIPTWKICNKCNLPKYISLVDNKLCNSNYLKEIIFEYSNRKIIHKFEFSMMETNPLHFSKQDKIMDYIIILKNKFNKYQKLKILICNLICKKIGYGSGNIAAKNIFEFNGDLYLQKYYNQNGKYIDWLENQVNHLKNQYE